MVEQPASQGRIMLFASSLDAIWTDFPLRSAYVPFWYRSVQYAARWQSVPAALRINQVVPVEETAEESTVASSGTWNLIDPQGRRVISLDQEPPGFVPTRATGALRDKKPEKVQLGGRELSCRGIASGKSLASGVPGGLCSPGVTTAGGLPGGIDQGSGSATVPVVAPAAAGTGRVHGGVCSVQSKGDSELVRIMHTFSTASPSPSSERSEEITRPDCVAHCRRCSGRMDS